MFVTGWSLTLSPGTGQKGFTASAISGKDLRLSGAKICFISKAQEAIILFKAQLMHSHMLVWGW